MFTPDLLEPFSILSKYPSMKQLYYPVVKYWRFLLLLLSISFSHHLLAVAQQPALSTGEQLPATQKVLKHNNLRKLSQVYDKQNGNGGAARLPSVGDNAQQRFEYELEMLQDPATGRIPNEIRKKELRFATRLNKREGMSAARMYESWEARGPYNVGGRTRALAIDRTNENVILAGGVSGGLWRSVDGGKSWRKATGSSDVQSITAIAQDPRPAYSNTWYYTTGERLGNSASGGGAFFAGNGVFRSVDGGITWKVLENTADDNPASYSPYDIVFNVAVHPLTGAVYLATWQGIYRSPAGGGSFTQVLSSGSDRWTDIMITPSGKIYVAVDGRGASSKGVFLSTDGTTWTSITPSGFPASYGRMVLGYAPANENIVYAFADNSSSGHLWRFTSNPAAATLEEQWTNLSANLPTAIGGSVGNLNTQGGYNMLVKVHPTQSNIVFVGGTNLYRSNTGFTTKAGQDSWIGGYSPRNNVSVYPNQHPDQHALVFYPSNPNKAISGNDGGVQLAQDITTSLAGSQPVVWESLNNGYLTTQPYTVSVNTSGTDDILVAGFQDNGTWLTTSGDLSTYWQELFSGDGSYNALADGGKTRYVSSQNGNIYRLNFASATDGADDYISFSKVTPAGASGFAFITPFILDPNDDNIMYLAVGGGVWRNSNLDAIPLFSNANTTVGWQNLQGSLVPAGQRVTALSVSRMPANRLYYGTNAGGIYRIDNASFGDQAKKDISTGKGLPAGFVNSIGIDPANADRVFVVFSNYNVRSVFYSENGGETWQDISGNLEQNSDGTGNGPSVRWFAVKGNSDGYFVGTSTGLYSTTTLAGSSTTWKQEDINGIGNVVVPMIQSREDGFIAVATHGNGLYSGRFAVSPLPAAKLSIENTINDYAVFRNSPRTLIDISNVFRYTGAEQLSLNVLNTNSSLVSARIEGKYLVIDYAKNQQGTASVAIVAKAGAEELLEPFTITVKDLKISLYEQSGPQVASAPSQFFTDFGALAQSADDFTIPAGQSWSIDEITARGGVNGAPVLNDIRVLIYQDLNGKPGSLVYESSAIVPASGTSSPNLVLKFATPITLSEGKYWISIFPVLAYNGGNQWFWSTQSLVTGSEAHFIDPANLFGRGAVNWTSLSTAFNRAASDMMFTLNGGGSGFAAPAAPTNLVATAESVTRFMLRWDDNATNEVAYKIERSTDGVNFSTYNMLEADANNFTDTDFFNPVFTYYYRVAAVGVGSTSAYSNVVSVAVIPVAPKVLPATEIRTLTQFVANWEATEGAQHYLLDISIDNFQTFVEEGIVVTETSYRFEAPRGRQIPIIPGRQDYMYRVRAVNAGGASPYSETMVVAKTLNLFLTPVCSDNPEVNRNWRINNPNPYAVKVSWQIHNTDQQGSYEAQPGESYFSTPTTAGPNVVFITWQDDAGRTNVRARVAATYACASGVLAANESTASQEAAASLQLLGLWPNPSTGKVSAMIMAPQEGEVSLEVVNSLGASIMKMTTPNNVIQPLDLTHYPAGVYMIRIEQGSFHEVLRMVKQ